MTSSRETVGGIVAGRTLPGIGERVIRRTSPGDGSPLSDVAVCGVQEVDDAVRIGAEAFDLGIWSDRSPQVRGEVLRTLADLVERDARMLAEMDAVEAGKPIGECIESDVPAALEALRWFAGAADKLYGATSPRGGQELGLTLREPIGVVAAIMPWNYPMAQTAWKLGPALAAGNSVLLKPAEQTPSSALHIARLAYEAGVPAEILSVLTGDGAVTGAAIASHPDIGALSFTGSTSTGRAILHAAASSNLKRVSLEMGGKSPQILLADALTYGEELFDQMIDAAFLTMGQNCTAGSRILVHESIADEVSDRFVTRARRLVVGPPLDPSTDIGPLITQDAADRVNALVDQAVSDGAEVLLRGAKLGQDGPTPQYVAPTVLRGCAPDSEIQQTEIFGPVATLTTFGSEAEAVTLANNTSYGLAASVWTRDLNSAMRLSRAVKAGVVSVNCYSEGGMSTPFGGYKQSGFGGKERAFDAFDQWTQTKTVWIHLHQTGER